MTAATTVTCASCQTPRPGAETYERVPHSGERFCTDTAGCRRRMAAIGDPVGEITPAPPPAVTGAMCSICGVTDPPGGAYERLRGQYACIDRAGCGERAVEYQYLHSWSDQSPDRLISAADMRAMAAAASPQVPPEPTVLSPDQMAALAAQDALGRKR